MIVLGFLLLTVALLASLVGWVWLLVTAFREQRYVWAVLMILFSPVVLVYGILNWSEVKRPFLIYLSGIPLVLMAYGLVFLGAAQRMDQLQIEAQTRRVITATEPASPPPATRPARPRPARATPSTDLAQGLPPAAPPKPSSLAAQGGEPPKTAPPADVPSAPPLAVVSPAVPLPAAAAPIPSNNQPATVPAPPSVPATSAAAAIPTLAPPPEPQVRTNTEVTVGFAGFLDDKGDILRNLKLRIVNRSDLAVRKLNMTFYYQDDQKHTLKEWTTEYEDPAGKAIAIAGAAREFKCPAFYMPDWTVNVIIRLREVGFADGSVWRNHL